MPDQMKADGINWGEVHKLPHIGSYDDEAAYNIETDAFNKRAIKVTCPTCKRSFAALCSPHTVFLESGWRWFADICQEPYAEYQTKCVKCGTAFRFGTHAPQ